ncbi:putative glucuronoxylan glucuronosyltransferase F8H [Wolffia australiana]
MVKLRNTGIRLLRQLNNGKTQCDRGWYGIDCSIPSTQSPLGEWPRWLRPAAAIIRGRNPESQKLENITVIVNKRRPLIYVYDLPPEFNGHLLEGRHFKFDCVNRFYSDRNRTQWTTQLYGSQISLYESILASPHRTMNGEEADYFYVPVLDACLITRADDAPHLRMDDYLSHRSYLALDMYRRAYDHILEHHPYWNRSSGRDHVWMFSWDEGACYAPKEIWNSMMLVHWGNTNSKYNHSTTAYSPDNWDPIPLEKRGNHPCFDPRKDLVIPAWKRPDARVLEEKFWARPRKERKTLFYFNGNLGPAYENGRPESTYSMGIRQKVAEEFGSTPNKEGKLGRQHAADIIVSPIGSPDYLGDLSRSVFCGVFPGDGWSGRMEDSILQGCIPVVIQDGIFLPYENVLNYKSFAVRITEDEIPNLISILRGFNESTIEMMLKNVRSIWQRFIYRDSVMLEAERQKNLFGNVEVWGDEFSKLRDDDVLATLIHVLHYKLHSDPWRLNMQTVKQAFGLPKKCIHRSLCWSGKDSVPIYGVFEVVARFLNLYTQ